MSMLDSYAEIDDSTRPIITVRFTGAPPNDANFEKYLCELHRLYEAHKEMVIIFDATSAAFPTFKYQKMQAEWIDTNESLLRKYCLASAYIIPNALVRNALKLIFLMKEQPSPYKVFSNEKDAMDWADEIIPLAS